MEKTKPFNLPKQLFVEAYRLVKANAGSAGVDKQSLTDFDKNLKDNLYKLWNQMSSGSYLPPPVKAVPIPKKTGGERILGIPTVGDRICQMVVKLVFEYVQYLVLSCCWHFWLIRYKSLRAHCFDWHLRS